MKNEKAMFLHRACTLVLRAGFACLIGPTGKIAKYHYYCKIYGVEKQICAALGKFSKQGNNSNELDTKRGFKHNRKLPISGKWKSNIQLSRVMGKLYGKVFIKSYKYYLIINQPLFARTIDFRELSSLIFLLELMKSGSLVVYLIGRPWQYYIQKQRMPVLTIFVIR